MQRGFLLKQPNQKPQKATPRSIGTHGIIELRPGLVCLEADVHHLSYLLLEIQKRFSAGPAFPRFSFGDRVACFLAVQYVGAHIVDAGVFHTCVINVNNELVMFGQNSFSQCSMPPDLGAVSAVAAGGYYTCAIKANGQLVCSSEKYTYDYNPPRDLGPVRGVACGEKHTCVIKPDGELQCFGRTVDDAGQSKVPRGLGPVSAVCAGQYHTCAVRATGELVCFGENLLAQSSVPRDLGKVLTVAAGDWHTCVIQINGNLVCFGCNDHGQCDVPSGLGPVKAVAAGQKHTCAVKVNGDVVCFGDNSSGQCSTPNWLDNVVSVAAGAYHTCAVQASGRLVCFGINGGTYDCGQCAVPSGLCVAVDLQPLPLKPAKKWNSLRAITEKVQKPVGCLVTAVRPMQQTPTHQRERYSSHPDVDNALDAPVQSEESFVSGNTIQEVQHSDVAAEISQDEASRVVDEQRATWIEHNITGSATPALIESSSEYHKEQAFEKVFLLRFSRNPHEFEHQLHEGRELEPVRTALQDAGFSSRLPNSGAAIFVHPEQYDFTRQLLTETSLRPYHVLVSEPFLGLVEEAVSSLRHGRRGNVRLRSISILAYCACRQRQLFVVEKTFLDDGRVRRNPQSVVQSTGVAHGVPNPRRVAAPLHHN